MQGLDRARAELLPAEFSAWKKCGHTMRILGHHDKILVVWKMFLGEPTVTGSVRVAGIDISEITGLVCDLAVDYNGTCSIVSIGHEWTPIIEDKLFGYIPSNFEYSFDAYVGGWSRVLRYPLVFRTESSIKAAEGALVVTQLSEFRNTFRQYKDLYL